MALMLMMAPVAGAADEAPLGRTLYNMGEQGSTENLQFVQTELENTNVHIRRIAVHALGKIGSPESVPQLIKIADDTNEAVIVRCSAIKALGRMGAKQARASLECLCDDPNNMLKTAALMSLAKLDIGY